MGLTLVQEHTPESPRAEDGATTDPGGSAGIERVPIWPDYFARLGQPDAASWQYEGYWSDTARVWRAYYTLVLEHPVVTFLGMRHFYESLVYRISNEDTGDHLAPVMTALTPAGMLLTPFVSLAAVAVAPPFLRRVVKTEIPPLFTPFSFMGWANYNVMLVTMFTMHSYKQQNMGWSPAHALRHSSKVFWHDFFDRNLPPGHHPTKQFAVIKDGVLKGTIPRADFVIKPTKGGAGHYLRTMTWDAKKKVYHCDDPERSAEERSVYTPRQLAEWIDHTYTDAVIERLEKMRAPFPVGSFRVMTLNVKDEAELIAAVFLPAPEGSRSTAYFDLDTYLVNYEDGTVGSPIRPDSDGRWEGIPVPELNGVIEACIAMHNELPAHVEISWDVLLTDHGPVYLEGNVFPPGCDYKLTVFKEWENFGYLRDRLLGDEPDQSTDSAADGSAGQLRASFERTMDLVERAHQTMATTPLAVAEQLGAPAETVDSLKRTQRRLLRGLYGGAVNAVGGAIGRLEQFAEFAGQSR